MAKHGTEHDGDGFTDGERVLHVRFRRGDDERIEEMLRALDRGETPEPYFEVTFHRIEDLNLFTRPTNLQLLRTIAVRVQAVFERPPDSSIEAFDRFTGISENSRHWA